MTSPGMITASIMTNQEIIDFLKQNRERGIAFDFMPAEVRGWCSGHQDEEIFHVYSSGCSWNDKTIGIDCRGSNVYCLAEDYELEPEFKPHWEEFDVYKSGFFRILRESDSTYYHWFNWQKFIEENFENYNAFGGWLFDDDLWTTYPQITLRNCIGTETLVKTHPNNIDDEIRPAIPTRVRFWRYRE